MPQEDLREKSGVGTTWASGWPDKPLDLGVYRFGYEGPVVNEEIRKKCEEVVRRSSAVPETAKVQKQLSDVLCPEALGVVLKKFEGAAAVVDGDAPIEGGAPPASSFDSPAGRRNEAITYLAGAIECRRRELAGLEAFAEFLRNIPDSPLTRAIADYFLGLHARGVF